MQLPDSSSVPIVVAAPLTRAQRQRAAQLLLALVATMAISSPQYVWTLFVAPIRQSLGVSLSSLQVTIAIFSVCMCGLAPIHGYIAQHMPRNAFVALGGILIGAGWVLSSVAASLPMLYFSYGVLCGLGAGMVYLAGTDQAAQWFPDRRGFAVGMVAAGYSLGAVITTFPINAAIRSGGYRHALLGWGALLGGLCVLAALRMRQRTESERLTLACATISARSYTPAQMLLTPSYWLLFAMMTMVGTGGLMVISQMSVFAVSFGIGPSVLVLGMAALPLALTLNRAANGVTRPLFGWISDHIGRENAMALAFALEGVSILLLMLIGNHPAMFVLLSSVVFLGWGEIFSLFPAVQADMFGPAHQATNLGFLLISIAVASVFGGPLAALLFERTGSWMDVFIVVSALDLAAAALAALVLKPMRRAQVERR